MPNPLFDPSIEVLSAEIIDDGDPKAVRLVGLGRADGVALGLPRWEAYAGQIEMLALATGAWKSSTVPVVKVRLAFRSSMRAGETATIRARSVSDHSANLVGSSAPTTVHFDEQGSALAEFALPVDGELGRVRYHQDSWTFESEAGSEFAPILGNPVQFHICFLIADPVSPWGAGTATRPWAAALIDACRWADGADTLDAAAARVMLGLNQEVRYDYEPSEARFARDDAFDFEGFLANALRSTNPRLAINCYDMAAAAACYCALLGRRFDVATLGFPRDATASLSFWTRPVTTFASAEWQTYTFSAHAVLWDGPLTDEGRVYEACIQPMADDWTLRHPTRAVVTGFAFGGSSKASYRERLLSEECRTVVAPLFRTAYRIAVPAVPDANALKSYVVPELLTSLQSGDEVEAYRQQAGRLAGAHGGWILREDVRISQRTNGRTFGYECTADFDSVELRAYLWIFLADSSTTAKMWLAAIAATAEQSPAERFEVGDGGVAWGTRSAVFTVDKMTLHLYGFVRLPPKVLEQIGRAIERVLKQPPK